MMKEKRRLYAKKQKRNLNQQNKKLAYVRGVKKAKHTRCKQALWPTRERRSHRPPKRKLDHYGSKNILYEISYGGSRHGLSSKIRQRPVNHKPIVTFKEKIGVGNGENTCHCHDHGPSNGFQFYLQDGRVDVSQVLKNLGLTKLQYEHEPGVWRAMKSLPSGKSIEKFQNNQEVQFRGDASTTHHAARKFYNWVDSWLVEHDTERTYNARVSRIVQKTGKGRIGVGTMVRVNTPLIPGLMLTCRHCVELNESGSINEKLLAFEGPVSVLYVSNKYDLALCEGPPGNDGFRLAGDGEEMKGREIRMLSYPWHVDLVYGLLEDVGPTQVHGNVCMFSPKGCEMPMEVDALGTYMGGFPASSGGAVTLNSKVLCGIHVGVIWHDKDELSMPLVLGSKGHIEPHRNSFHMELCAKRKKVDEEHGNLSITSEGGQSQIPRNYCSSSHGYLATYVSSSHIEEVFQDYLESIRNLDSKSECY